MSETIKMHKTLAFRRLLSSSSSCKSNHHGAPHRYYPNERKGNKNNKDIVVRRHNSTRRWFLGNHYFSCTFVSPPPPPPPPTPLPFLHGGRCYVSYLHSHSTHWGRAPLLGRQTLPHLQNAITTIGNTAKYHDINKQQRHQQDDDTQNVPATTASEEPVVSPILVTTKLSDEDLRHLDKTTQRLLETPVGAMNPAGMLEFTTSIYSWHSRAISNPYNTQVFDKCKQLFDRMMEEAQVNPFVHVDIETINRVLDTWRIIAIAHAPTKFQKGGSRSTSPPSDSIVWKGSKVLQKIIECSSSKNACDVRIDFPNDKSFNMILDAYAKFGLANEAQLVLEEMNQLATREGQPQCRPDTITYNTLLSAHCNSIVLYRQGGIGTQHAEKAMDLLEDMLQVYNDTGNLDIKPDVISFSTVIAACANAATLSPSFAQVAEDILKQMKEMYEESSSLMEQHGGGNGGGGGGGGEWLGLRPNHVCYSSAINAWSNSGVPDAAMRASLLFAEMQSQGDVDVPSMTSLLEAYGNSSFQDGNGFQQAESMLNQMIQTAQESGNMAFMPNVITFTALIDSLAQSLNRSLESDGGVAARKAEEIFKQMEDLYSRGVDIVKPSTITYNALINVWSKTRTKNSGEKAAYWLSKMEENGDVRPNDATYATVIDAYARCGNPSKAEEILLQMIEKAKEDGSSGSGSDSCKPNTICFSAAINAYANVGKPNDAERLIKMMKKLHDEEEYTDLKPDSYCYNGVINAYIRSRENDRLDRCLHLLDEMDTLHVSTTVSYTAVIESLAKTKRTFINGEHVCDIATRLLERMWSLFYDGRESVMPTAVTYASVINLFAKSQRHDKAEYYLEELEKKYQELEYDYLRPNTICYNTCLSSFSKASSKEEALRAESILQRMQERADDAFLKPDAFTLTNVISAWANSNNPERAEAILNTMQTMYENGDISMKPTTVSFGAVLHAWARAGNIERAEKIVEHMESLMHLEGFEEMRPNAVIYNILINCCAKCSSPAAVHKAQNIVDKMRKYKDAGYSLASPNIITYNSVLAALNSGSGTDSYPEACKILQEIEEARSLDPTMNPTAITYTSFLRILAKSRVPNKSVIAERIIENMETNPNDHKLIPNNLTYDAVLKVCSSLPTSDPTLQRHALVLAVKTLTKMQQLPHIVPTSFTYYEFFTALSKLTKGEELLKLIERSFDDCIKAGVLDDKILRVLAQTTPKDFLQKLLKLNTANNIHKVSINGLPQSWSCNAKRSITMKSQRTNEQIIHNTGRSKIRR